MPPLEPWERITDTLASMAAVGGLDLAAPLDLDFYNAVVDESYRVPTFGRAGALGIVLGNTRALWPCFVAAMREDEALFACDDPLDHYVERVVQACLPSIPFASEVRFAHEPPPRRVAMQTLADVAGLAPLSESRLNVHRIFGPWIALRALVIVDVDGPPPPATTDEPCSHCNMACAPLVERALAGGAGWRDWVAVRDACPTGREHRYGEAQIHYHYTKDLAALRAHVRPAAEDAAEGDPP